MKHFKLLMMLALLVMGISSGFAQNVTVRPDNGSMMPALKSGNTDTFYEWGGFATWKHEQLSLTMTTGDSDNNLTDDSNQLTGSGQLAKPANNIFASSGVATFNYITFVSGGTTYYLNLNNNNQPRFTTEKATIWEVDDDGYVHSGNTYLACSSSGNPRTLTTTTGNQRRLQINNNGRLYCNISSGWGYTTYYLHGTTDASATPTLTNNQTGLAEWTEETVSTTKCLQIGKGRSSRVNGQGVGLDCYLTFALPKGYRFTGYTIIFHRISSPNGAPSSGLNEWDGNINFGETNNAFTYRTTTNSTDDNLTTYYGGIPQNNTTQHTISRTSDTDMTNVLYFKLDNGRQYTSNTGRAFIQLDHVELYFTAENNTQLTIPSTALGTSVSAIDIPFTTSKVDYGQLIMRDVNGNAQGTSGYDSSTGRMSYDGVIRDMNANMILYEDGSIKREDEDNGFDGTVGKVLHYHSGSITAAGEYFMLDPSNHHFLTDDGEAIYYIESPIWAMNTAAGDAAHKNPIGYRIVSAKFTCAPGTGGNIYLPATFKIQYESVDHGPDQNGTYGLNTFSTTYNWNPSYHTVWRIDQQGYIYGYVSYDGSIRYLAVNGNNISMVTTKPSEANGTFEVVNNQIRLISDPTKYIGWNETVDGQYVDDNGYTNDNVTRYFVIAADEAHRSTYHQVTAASESSSGAYTFKIYKPDGTTVEETIDGTVGGTKTVYGYNNDAIKIGVIGGTALFNAEITMQALDPYIDRLDIVCQENGGTGGKLTQQFSATDFAVKGGKFTFYVPQGFPAPAKFTFENLYSHYGDNNYYNANNNPERHARYFFVKSDYEQTAANVYDRNNEDSYTTKILTEKTGDKKFTFNNASTVSSTGGYFEEYAFTPSIYTKSTTQGGAGGTFDDFTFSQTEMANHAVKTAYLFTCDEPRYNIAPTTATQHVFYAFYEMQIDMQTKTYAPILTWKKLYDKTFYSADNTNIKRDSKWGLELNTTETVDDHGTHSGYLTVTQIKDAITTANGIVQNIGKTVNDQNGQFDIDGDGDIDKDDLDAASLNEDAEEGILPPAESDQILYIDGSKLMSIVENQTSTGTGSNVTYTSHPKSELMDELDENALIYLPYGSKSSDDNFAFNTIEDYTKTPIFRGANNIVIADRYPFYAPYDIQVDAAKMAMYERTITNPTYDPILHATIVLPFEINVDANGKHTNGDNAGTPFTLSTMNEENSLSKVEGSKTDFGKGYFTPISEKSVPNKPYIVTLDDAGEDSFIAHVNGSLVKATPEAANGVFTNEESTGTFEGTNYNFTHTGTYTGKEIENASTATETVFYFANNNFLDSKTLKTGKSLKILPFRSFYAYTTSGSGAKMTSFSIVFGENMDDGSITGISNVQRDADLAIIPGYGTITLMAKADKDVTIHAVNGHTMDKCNLKAGDSRTVSLPAGVYVVNGVKMIVK